ncbi:MAG: DUF1778 domain-containing protein [Propionibacteriaceae bacterium]|jgi:uncharacterized protein (DUF1778 family)|nr:DUF1778 domain-containing protein [Propionibacteriaceae bacterium]
MPRTHERTSRIDVRLTDAQRQIIEQAAELSGSTLTGWAIPALLDAAHRDIAAAATSSVPAAQWEEFLALLDQEQPEQLTELKARTPVWSQ